MPEISIDWEQVGRTLGFTSLGVAGVTGISLGFEAMDVAMGKADAPMSQRPSTWLELGGGVVSLIGAGMTDRPDLKTALTILGVGLLADLVLSAIRTAKGPTY